MNNDYLERNQTTTNSQIIDIFINAAGEKLGVLTDLAEELQEHSGCSFERALADALEAYKLK
jgi:hypothetical protein